MGYDLHRRRGGAYDGPEDYHVNVSGWSALIDLGLDGGWGSFGTEPPEGYERRRWSGAYGTNDGQYVTAVDAAAWADAIEAAKGGSLVYRRHPGFIDRFVAYCRGGGFEIH